MRLPSVRRMLAGAATVEVAAVTGDRVPADMARANRVVVYGSRLSGAFGLAVQFQGFLAENGIENPVVQGERFSNNIRRAFYGIGEDDQAQPTIPRGVIALHEMRQEDPYSRSRMFINTPYGFIQELCDRHDVPMVRIAEAPTPEAIGSAVTGLLVPENRMA